ncbi:MULTISPECIES: HAMP domain-containing sensor histidine kinase [unclassified Polaromonas]|uniref:sensor histidine kinase n=1 Tax=unclassified Polaromonas TaxID=2638319 RepID=UPI000F0737E2|nr:MULTISPECIES: HAMP domain-containing sensor histidine kinase [unclassified Polaromonas]AYQ28532.1 sensor histidine kinase [Polaromonas sp. SP1]QGJ20352.1 sensor histidine kinase [Polaromonas sp. Pch-P]
MDSFSAIGPSPSAPELSREEWVEMRLTHTFMRYARPALHAALVLVLTMVLVLYRHVDPIPLGLWATAAALVTLARYRVIGIYQQTLVGVSGAPLRAFMARYSWTWPVSAIVWGASMFVYFLKAPVYDQFLCMVVLVGMAGFAVGTFSSSLSCFKGYVNGLGLSVVAVLVYQLVLERGLPSTFNTYAMIALVLIYWAVILVSGQRFHEVQRVNLELQFDNSQLIRSLTETNLAAVEAVQTKNRFIASAAHDLRQPVHALGLYADWLATEPEFVEQIAPKIVRSTKAVNDLFNSLFDLAGLEADPLRVHLQDIDLAGLIQDLEAQYTPFARERNLLLRTRAAPWHVRSDPVLLQRLVGNLLSNALRNTYRGGVLLALRKRRGVPCIEIWDTGVGIAKEHQKAIFQEFYRVPLQGTEEGFGLGLAIVSRLSEVLGHPVGLASRGGRGSVFWVELRQA